MTKKERIEKLEAEVKELKELLGFRSVRMLGGLWDVYYPKLESISKLYREIRLIHNYLGITKQPYSKEKQPSKLIKKK